MDVQILSFIMYQLFHERPSEITFSRELAERYRDEIELDVRKSIFETLDSALKIEEQDYLHILPFDAKYGYSNDDLKLYLEHFLKLMKEYNLNE